jgi:hypothetical protein
MWDRVSNILAKLFFAWLVYLVVCIILFVSGLAIHLPEQFFYGIPQWHIGPTCSPDADITCPGGY